MSRTLIGSSNIYRHYRLADFKHLREYSIVRCVNIESFVAQIASIEANETEVVISVVENFIAKAGSPKEVGERRKSIEAVIKSYTDQVGDVARKNPGSRFILVDPILRPKLPWYDDELDEIKFLIKKMVQATGLGNISIVDVMTRAAQQFEEDAVHLTNEAGKIFVGAILDAAEEIFKAPYVDLVDTDGNEADETIMQDPSTPVRILERRLSKLENDTEERKWNDNILFARTREELDTMANKAKEDRIIMTGLTSTKPPPRDWDQRKVWMRDLVVSTIRKFKPDFDGKIGFINQGKNNGRDIPMVEAKMSSAPAAMEIRKIFAEKRKEGDGKAFGRLHVANSVSLSTRVRVDIMKAMAKKISDKNFSAHVAAYSSRPILHVREIGKPESSNRAFTFIDAILRYGGSVGQDDLEEAYKRAGSAFKGQLEQHFVVLKEMMTGPPPKGTRPGGTTTTGPSGGAKGGKRPRESDEIGESSSKKK